MSMKRVRFRNTMAFQLQSLIEARVLSESNQGNHIYCHVYKYLLDGYVISGLNYGYGVVLEMVQDVDLTHSFFGR